MTASALRAHLAERRKDRPKLDAEGNPEKDATGKAIMVRGIGARRHNAILAAWGGFFRWAVRERRAYENPVVHIARLSERIDKRHERRALTPDEARRLMAAAVAGGERAGMAGAERSLFYRTMLETGLRLNETKTLTRGNVAADTLTVNAGFSKHRREDVLPIRKDLAAALTEHGAHKAPAARLFNVPDRWRMLDAFKDDLAAAGIPYQDADGKYADIHALRHTFISTLGAAGVNPKTMQALARHSTVALTLDKYTHLRLGDEVAAIAQLPNYATPAAAVGLRTGTDDAPAIPDGEARKSTPPTAPKAPANPGERTGEQEVQFRGLPDTMGNNRMVQGACNVNLVAMRVSPVNAGENNTPRGRSSIGRALALQARGCRFDPGRLHSS